MPAPEQILESLKNMANTFQLTAIFWHFCFAVFIIILLTGKRPSKSTTGILLSFPLITVAATAWIIFNPFNGLVFSIVGVLMLYFSVKLPKEHVTIAPMSMLIPGIIMIIFGWIYPHFIETDSVFTYLYKAPTGVIPCATLSILIGFTLLLNNLNSRAFSLTLSIMGLFYGITGVMQLHVYIDLILLAGSLVLFTAALKGKSTAVNQPSAA